MLCYLGDAIWIIWCIVSADLQMVAQNSPLVLLRIESFYLFLAKTTFLVFFFVFFQIENSIYHMLLIVLDFSLSSACFLLSIHRKFFDSYVIFSLSEIYRNCYFVMIGYLPSGLRHRRKKLNNSANFSELRLPLG